MIGSIASIVALILALAVIKDVSHKADTWKRRFQDVLESRDLWLDEAQAQRGRADDLERQLVELHTVMPERLIHCHLAQPRPGFLQDLTQDQIDRLCER